MSTTSRRLQGCPITLALAAWLIASPATAAWLEQPGQARPAELPSGHDDPSIRRALALLPVAIPVPVEVVSAGKLPRSLGRALSRSCAFVLVGDPRIYVNSSCRAYIGAETHLLEAMKLAAMLRHELAHLHGADESQACVIESRTFRELLRRAPAESLVPGMIHAVALEQHAQKLLAQRAQRAVAQRDAIASSEADGSVR